MATLTTTRSAYPVAVEVIAEQVRDRVAETGDGMPSRNQIMTEFKVGAPKARRVLDLLTDTQPEPARTVPAPTAAPVGDGSDQDCSVTPEPAAPADPADTPTQPLPVLTPDPGPVAAVPVPADAAMPLVDSAVDPGTAPAGVPATPLTPVVTEPAPTGVGGRVRTWPVLVIALGAFVAIWGGWVGLGRMTGFGEITPLPGIADGWTIDSAITLPLGVEAYAAFALRVWLSGRAYTRRARRFAMCSALGALLLGMAGQVAYHLMSAAGLTTAPWPITTAVSCLPVLVLGLAAALAHLMHDHNHSREVSA